MPQAYNGLFDVGTNVLLVTHQFVPAVVFLAEAIPNSYADHGISVNVKNAPNFATLQQKDNLSYAWTKATRTFSPTPPGFITDEIRARSRLAIVKAETIMRIILSVGYMRTSIGTGVLFQESVYQNKRREAEQLQRIGYAIESLHDFPYVVQYADYAGISVKEASEEILFRARLDDHLLAKTEIVRIRYFNRVKAAQRPEEMGPIMDDFARDTYLNGQI